MIDYKLENDIAILSMDDGKANVFSQAQSNLLGELLERAEKEAKAVAIMGREGQFSGGYDLSVMKSGDQQAMVDMIQAGFDMLFKLVCHPQPVIAGCTGNAFGLGAFVLLAADTRIGANSDYKICLPETRASMYFTPNLITLAKARLNPLKFREAALQSMPYSPKAAVEAGFLDMLVDADKVEETVLGGAALLTQLPSKYYGENKRDLLADLIRQLEADMEVIRKDPMALLFR